jgi:hypothetical protein
MSVQSQIPVNAAQLGDIGVPFNPRIERIAAVVLNSKTFVTLLVLATVVPTFISALTLFNLIAVTWIIAAVTFLAQVHVPMTLYLLSDQQIGAQMWQRKVLMVGGCLFFVVLSMYVFTAFSVARGSKHTEILYLFALGAIMWQHWHFGKQNLGVLALSRIATRTGSVTPFERYTLVAGAICGMAAAYLMIGKSFQQLFSPNGDLGMITAPLEFVSTQFRWFQYFIGAMALAYTAYNFRRFTPSTALLYVLGVCFFLPTFLAIDLPQYFFIFGAYISAHGSQYMVILFYHSLGSMDIIRRSDGALSHDRQLPSYSDNRVAARRIMRTVRFLSPLFFFALAMTVVVNFYTTHGLWSFNDVIWRIANRGMHLNLDVRTVSGMAVGLIWGILLCHFWLDSFFWRLKDKTPREWIKSRYAFLFTGLSKP